MVGLCKTMGYVADSFTIIVMICSFLWYETVFFFYLVYLVGKLSLCVAFNVEKLLLMTGAKAWGETHVALAMMHYANPEEVVWTDRKTFYVVAVIGSSVIALVLLFAGTFDDGVELASFTGEEELVLPLVVVVDLPLDGSDLGLLLFSPLFSGFLFLLDFTGRVSPSW